MPDILEGICEDMSRSRRLTAALKLVEDLTTEEIEALNRHLPYTAKCAVHELLNPEVA
jgi:hypothetical protein